MYIEETNTAYKDFNATNEYVNSVESGEVHLYVLKNMNVTEGYLANPKNITLIIEGNNHTFNNKFAYTTGYQFIDPNYKLELRGIVVESPNYELYRPEVIINNLTVKAQCECFYAADTADVTLNNCKGVTNFVDRNSFGTSVGFMESVLAASYDSKLTVNKGEFTSSNYGARIYSTGGKIYLNNSKIIANTVLYTDSPSSSEAISNSTIYVNSGNYQIDMFAGANNPNNEYIGEIIIKGGTFSVDPTIYVNTTTHDIVNNGNTWTVSAKAD